MTKRTKIVSVTVGALLVMFILFMMLMAGVFGQKSISNATAPSPSARFHYDAA